MTRTRAHARPTVPRRCARNVHSLKTHRQPFGATWNGLKVHEYRRDDRGFRVGDELRLREWDACTCGAPGCTDGSFTNRELRALVTYLSRGPAWGIPEGFAVMSVKVVQKVLR